MKKWFLRFLRALEPVFNMKLVPDEPAPSKMTPDHRWSGWPGAWCQDCGTSDMREECLAKDGHDIPCGLVECQNLPCRYPNTYIHDQAAAHDPAKRKIALLTLIELIEAGNEEAVHLTVLSDRETALKELRDELAELPV
jgi:hypothetical protein